MVFVAGVLISFRFVGFLRFLGVVIAFFVIFVLPIFLVITVFGVAVSVMDFVAILVARRGYRDFRRQRDQPWEPSKPASQSRLGSESCTSLLTHQRQTR